MESPVAMMPPLVTSMSSVCFPKMKSSSDGVWLHNDLLSSALPLLMLQIIIIVVLSRIIRFALRPLSSPGFVSELLAGFLLGPSALGRIEIFRQLFAPTKTTSLRILGLIGLVIYYFISGVNIDLSMIRTAEKKAIIIGLCGHFFPAALAWGIYRFTRYSSIVNYNYMDVYGFPDDRIINDVLMWSLSATPVVANLVVDTNVLNSKLGRLAVASSLVESLLNLLYRRFATVLFAGMRTDLSVLGAALASLVFLFCLTFVARPMVKRMLRKTPEGSPLSDDDFVFLLVVLLVGSFSAFEIGQFIGISIFYIGLILPSGPPLGSTLSDRLLGVASVLTFPVFFGILGLRNDFHLVIPLARSVNGLVIIDSIVIVAKFVTVVGVSFLCKLSFHSSVTLAVIMSAKGISELQIIFVQQENANPLPLQTLWVLFLAVVTAPLVKIMYQPSKRYKLQLRRSVMHASNSGEFRIVHCVHTEDHVPPAVNLLASFCSDLKQPIGVYLIHLTPLFGSITSLMIPYRKGRNLTTTERIVSGFSALEKKYPRCVLQPYVNNAPYSSMYDDICDLALEKNTPIILLPFHRTEVQDTVESMSGDMREVNRSVLRYAPCSVAILVDHGFMKDVEMALANPIASLVVYFVGGPDDREAVALGIRMALNSAIGLSVIRFRPKDEEQAAKDDTEEKLDNDMIFGLSMINVNSSGVVCREELVEDGEEMVDFMRMTSHTFDLIIVGRGEGRESALTEGLSMWSEFPELGLLGDLLASKDFGTQVSTLVVQQQQHKGGS